MTRRRGIAIAATCSPLYADLATAIRRRPHRRCSTSRCSIAATAAAGTGLSKYLTLHGLVHHTVYHAGQIAQLRRALR